jgi:COP9 signalosome complex subunit 4
VCGSHAALRRTAAQEDDDALSAETFIKKAAFLVAEAKDEALELQYNTCYARILDSKVRHGRAAPRNFTM